MLELLLLKNRLLKSSKRPQVSTLSEKNMAPRLRRTFLPFTAAVAVSVLISLPSLQPVMVEHV